MTDKTILALDVNNLLWTSRYEIKLNMNKKEEFVTELIFTRMVQGLNNSFRKYKATGVLAAFEGKGNWRRRVYDQYKVKDEDSDLYYEDVKAAEQLFWDFLTQYTSVKCCSVERAEADDVISVLCQSKDDDTAVVIVSTDRDFEQLLVYPNVTVYSQVQKVDRHNEDPEYSLFLKCIRGDRSDNIHSAYPRVREKLLKEAYYSDDPTQMMNLMGTTLKDGSVVGENYKFNKTLIDLTQQPPDIRDAILLDLQTPTDGKYDQKEVMKFVRDVKAPNLISDVMEGKVKRCLGSQFSI